MDGIQIGAMAEGSENNNQDFPTHTDGSDNEGPNITSRLNESNFHTYTRQPSIFDKLTLKGQPVAERTKRCRLVGKDGQANVTSQNISDKKSKFLVDFFTTLLDLKWRYCVLIFASAHILLWLGFAVIYYIICIIHEDHLHMDDPDWKPCHCNVYDFTTAFLFSLETQHTIGYGFRGMEPNCVPSMITLAAQSCSGVFFQCIVTGLVFAKLSRPKRRAQTIMFSEKAVICKRDNQLYLLFRVGDMRKTHITGANIRVIMVKNRLTKEGELIPFCQYPMQLETDTSPQGDNFLFLMWPVTVAHRIDKDSPLWDISAKDLPSQHFEIVVILEGTVASTGMATQVLNSYVPSDIEWGHYLEPLMTYKKEAGRYKIDHQMFHTTVRLDNTPECSARELSKRRDSLPQYEEVDYGNFIAKSNTYKSRRNGNLQQYPRNLGSRRHSENNGLPPILATSTD